MMEKISIIVPIYNVEEYLNACVDSILSQSLNEIEIILVDDGSTDNCGEICDQYAIQDSRIKVIHKINGGLSDARNAGIAQAKGEYVGFVDGDDYIEPEMFEVLYRACVKDNTKIAACDYVFKSKKNESAASFSTGEYKKLPSEEFFLEVLKTPSATGMGVWNKLYRRDLFQNAQFRTGKLHEDTDILYRLIFQTDFVSYVSRPYYIHCERDASITKQRYGKREYDRYDANGRMFRYIAAYHPGLMPAAADNHCRSMISIIDNMADSGVYDKKMYRRIRREVRNLLPVLRRYDGASVMLRWKLRLISFDYFLYGYIRWIFIFLKDKGFFRNHESNRLRDSHNIQTQTDQF